MEVRGQFESQFSPSIMWVPGIEIRLSGWASVFIHSVNLTGPLI